MDSLKISSAAEDIPFCKIFLQVINYEIKASGKQNSKDAHRILDILAIQRNLDIALIWSERTLQVK